MERPPHLLDPLLPHFVSSPLRLLNSPLQFVYVLAQLLDPWLVVPVKPWRWNWYQELSTWPSQAPSGRRGCSAPR